MEAVYQLLRMFEAHAHGDALGLHGYAFVAEKMIYIACRVAGSEYYRAFPNFAAAVGHGLLRGGFAVEHYVGHSGAEVHLSPAFIMVQRIALITAGRRSVPICGCASTRILS